MNQAETNKQLVTAFFAALNAGDSAAIVAAYAEDGTVWTSGRTLISGSAGRAQIRDNCALIFQAFPDGLLFRIHAMVAESDKVAVEAESRGRHASGAIYNNLYHFLFRFRDGLIVELREYMDTELVTEVLCAGQRPPTRH